MIIVLNCLVITGWGLKLPVICPVNRFSRLLTETPKKAFSKKALKNKKGTEAKVGKIPANSRQRSECCAALLSHIGYARSLYMPNREKPKSETANSHWCAQGVVICLLIGLETGFNYQLDTDNN